MAEAMTDAGITVSAEIDELGYLPLPAEAEAASALFQVVSRRYLKRRS